MTPTDTTTEIVRRHGPEVMAVARRWAETPEDAEDAYQRGLEIMLKKAPSTDPDHLVPWLKTVVKREAWAVRRQRERHTPSTPDDSELDPPVPGTAHDHAVRSERLQLGAEAMGRLKPQEVRALALKAEGLSYREICEETGWTYTKVNRCLSEGRRRFHDRLAGIESGAECERLAPQLSALADGEARADDMAALRPHLRTCLVCRARLRAYRTTAPRVAAVAPPVAAGGLLAGARELLAALTVRWHHAAELAAAHKVAAVAASTAVLAGGGAASVATVDGGRRADGARPTPGSSVTAPERSGDRNAGPRGSSGGGGARRAAPDGAPAAAKPAPVDSAPAPTAPRAGEPGAQPSSTGEFTPDPGRTGPAAARPAQPAPAAGSESGGGGEFAP